jgi:hypothetical protein
MEHAYDWENTVGGCALLKRGRHNLERGYKQNHASALEGYIEH